MSADSVIVKVEPFHKDWVAMMSADDLTQCIPVIERAAEYVAGRANKPHTIRSAFKRAFSQHLVEMREDAALSHYGLTMKEFIKSGKKRFNERMFQSICKNMDDVKLGCEFIVAGFDSLTRPHIFHVTNEGKDSIYDKPGYHCIGSGSLVAESILYYFGQSIDRTFHETIFNVCAAKFMAERCAGVGKATYLYARKYGSNAFAYVSGMVEGIRASWDERGCPRVPEGLIRSIGDVYHPRCE
jgi:hypothetical protein